MSPAVWRAAALTCIALAIAFIGYQLTLPDREDFGIQFIVPANAPGIVRVIAVEPHSPAANAGIRVGDTIWYGDTALARASVLYATGGSHVSVVINGSRTVTMTARRLKPLYLHLPWSLTVIRLAFLLVAGLLAWRRPDDPSSRALVAVLACYGVAISLASGVLPTPLLSIIVFQFAQTALFLLGTGAAALFAARFPSGVAHPLARQLSLAAFAFAVALLLFELGTEWLPRSAALVSLLTAAAIAGSVIIGLLVLATFIVAYTRGAREDRQRRRWVFLILGMGLCAFLTDIVGNLFWGNSPLVEQALLLVIGLVPIGPAYVILRHRVIDVGFVLNRAVVYTGVSIIVVGIFVIVETLLAKYVESTSHVTSTAVEMAVALGLGFSIRYVHARVDRFVDNVLFRERHLAEAAIRDFAHDASYITDASTLLARCITTVEKNAHTRGAGIWIAQGTSYTAAASTFNAAPATDENDPAVVAMRARRISVHPRDCESALPGALAFPMIVRGELLGILVCGPKTDDETYAPDEQAALASLAGSVGHALDAIEVRELRRRLEALTATGGGRPAF